MPMLCFFVQFYNLYTKKPLKGKREIRKIYHIQCATNSEENKLQGWILDNCSDVTYSVLRTHGAVTFLCENSALLYCSLLLYTTEGRNLTQALKNLALTDLRLNRF